jgi:hypothetical protein
LRLIQRHLSSRKVSISPPFGHGSSVVYPYDVCDLNPSNLLVVRPDRGFAEIRVVDFAFQSPSYGWKNDLNFARAFANLDERPLLRFSLRVSGFARLSLKLVGHQFLSRRKRIINRFPSLLSFLFTEALSRFGHLLRNVRSTQQSVK